VTRSVPFFGQTLESARALGHARQKRPGHLLCLRIAWVSVSLSICDTRPRCESGFASRCGEHCLHCLGMVALLAYLGHESHKVTAISSAFVPGMGGAVVAVFPADFFTASMSVPTGKPRKDASRAITPPSIPAQFPRHVRMMRTRQRTRLRSSAGTLSNQTALNSSPSIRAQRLVDPYPSTDFVLTGFRTSGCGRNWSPRSAYLALDDFASCRR
jgi:hypothetical protein